MKPAVADRLSRVLVGCYPPRWKQRYAAEMLDVLDQHRTGLRTVLSLAGAVLSTHLDPSYRMEAHPLARMTKDAWLAVAIAVAVPSGVLVPLVVTQVAKNVRESSWRPSGEGAVAAVAFSRNRRILVSAAGGTPWDATSTLWDVADQAKPRPLSVFEGGNPITISPDGRTVATNAFSGKPALWNVTRPRHPARLAVLSAGFSGALWGEAFSPDGRILAVASTSRLVLWNVADPARPRLLRALTAPLRQRGPAPVLFGVGNADLVFSRDGHILAAVSGSDQVTVWNVTRPADAGRVATLTGPRDYFTALAFSPGGNLLAGVTYHGSLLVFRLGGAGRQARVSILPGILATARYPGGGTAPAVPCAPGCGPAVAASAGFTQDGHGLTVVIDRPETDPATAARDTVFTWRVASSGALSDLTTIYRDVRGVHPTLAPGARIVVDGSLTGGQIHLWNLP